MSKQIINIGTAENDKAGDLLRTAFNKVNLNFTELYTSLANQVSSNILVNGTHELILGADGNLTFPDGSIQTTAFQISDPNVWVEDFTISGGRIVAGSTSIEYDADGNIIAVFAITDSNTSFTNTLVAKFDTLGNKQWEVIFDGGLYTDGWGLAVDPVNNFGYVAGRTSTNSYNQSLLTKINLANGNVIWSKQLDYESASNSPVVDVGGDGNPVVVGYANNGTDDYITIIKILASDGSMIWGKSLNGFGDEQAIGMAIGALSEVVVVGYEAQFDETSNNNRVLVAMFIANGNLAWQKSIQIDAGYACHGADADIDSLGNVYVCGDYTDVSSNDQAIFMFKLSSTGAGQWTRKVKGNCYDIATSVVVGPDNHLYLSGVTGNNPTEDFSLVIAKYNLDGTVAWQRLLDNKTTWTFGGNWWFGNGGGSNLAVKDGYVAVGGGFADPFGTAPRGIVAQFNTNGSQFFADNYDFKPATFSGLLTGAPIIANDIRVVSNIQPSITNFSPDWNSTQFALSGEVHVSGSSNVDLGNITFVSNRIIGSGADSGDGLNYNTIQLVPDASLYNSHQYLIIDPTDPTHIHIRAGGAQDASNALLFLGGEQTNVMVSDYNHFVNIKTWNGTNTNYEWTFGGDGKTTFPTLSVDLHNGGVQQGQTLQFADPSKQAIITGPTPADGNSAERLIIQGQRGTGQNAEGGDVYVWAGDSDSNGGDIKIYAGDADAVPGNGGYINIDAGNGYANGGDVTITAGSSAQNGGNVRITSGYASQGISGRVELSSAGGSWTFGNNGITDFPNNKIKSSVSTSLSIETESLPTDPPTTITISGADFVAVNLIYTKDGINSNWYPTNYTPGTDPFIEFRDGYYGIYVPGFAQALYVNTGSINVPLAQWNTNPPLGSVAPIGVYTYPATYTHTWAFKSIGALNLPNLGTVPGAGDGTVGDICRNGDVLYFKTSSGWATIGLTL